jgi:hypothetical protein
VLGFLVLAYILLPFSGSAAAFHREPPRTRPGRSGSHAWQPYPIHGVGAIRGYKSALLGAIKQN